MSNISVIIPHYNNAQELERAYNSVINQLLMPNELIIVDDCSMDITYLKLIEKEHSAKFSLKVIYLQENSGPSFARNLGVSLSTCEYIAFLDCDDVWHPEKLLIQYSYMVENGIKFTFHKYSAYPEKKINEKFLIKKINVNSLAIRQIICTPTVMLKKDCFKEFNEDLRYCEDFLCWVMSNNSKYFYMIDMVLSNGFKRQYGDSGLSSNLKEMHKGFLLVCYILWSKNYWGLGLFMYFIFFEYIKYPLRLLKSFKAKYN